MKHVLENLDFVGFKRVGMIGQPRSLR